MPFDPDSGLVYNEKTVKQHLNRYRRDGHRTKNPMRYCLGTPPVYCPPPQGAESLASIAMRSILRNVNKLDSESLSTVPAILLEQIWKAIQRSQLDSIALWQLFAESSIGDRSTLPNRMVPRLMDVQQTIDFANHPTCAWTTTLDIMTDNVSPVDLTYISQLKNLRRFSMATSDATPADKGFNDRVLRSWNDLAREDGAFSNLKSIFLYFQNGVSRWALEHLDAFPVLDEFCAYRCKLRRYHAKFAVGWRDNADDSFVGFLRSSKAYTYSKYNNEGRTLSWKDMTASYLNKGTADSSEPIDRRPVLNVPLHDAGRAPSGYRILDVDAIVCLKRAEGHQPPRWARWTRKLKSEHLEYDGVKTEGVEAEWQPYLKKRKVVSNSSALEDMMSG